MKLTAEDLAAIDAAVERRVAPLRALILQFPPAHTAVASLPPLPHKLTLHQFAHCIERCYHFVAEETRKNRKLIPHVQGKRRKLIHPAALALYGVDSGMAAARLAQLEQRSAA